MKPRPVFKPTYNNASKLDEQAIFKHEFSVFREEERAWFEELLASLHVQAVLHIPEDEPIFVLRAKDVL